MKKASYGDNSDLKKWDSQRRNAGKSAPAATDAAKFISVKNVASFNRLKGKLLIKVEDAGKAYYVHPAKQTIHYLGRPEDAFAVMRGQGIGIKNSDLYKIPVGTVKGGVDTDKDGLNDELERTLGLNPDKNDTDGDGYKDGVELGTGFSPWGKGFQKIDANFAVRQKGKILLQVEKAGEAWYVNPADGKRYFLGRPADAFQAMRALGLGISNSDFNKLVN
jgi:hypothetical protein